MDSLNDLADQADSALQSDRHPAEVHEDIAPAVDFSEVELADEFADAVEGSVPQGMLQLDPSPIEGRLRKAALRVPDEIEEASGFTLFGRRIKSLL